MRQDNYACCTCGTRRPRHELTPLPGPGLPHFRCRDCAFPGPRGQVIDFDRRRQCWRLINRYKPLA